MMRHLIAILTIVGLFLLFVEAWAFGMLLREALR